MRTIPALSIPMLLMVACATQTHAGAPQYTIHDIGIVNPGDFGTQGFRVSSSGIATGRSLGSIGQAFRWTESGGLEPLPNLPGRDFNVGNGVNASGIVVGTAAQTSFGSGPLPVLWTANTVQQLVLPAGESLGRANDINDSGVAVGSADGGSNEVAVIYGETSEIITTTTDLGARMTTAFSINNAGRVVGPGVDPANAARNVGMVYDSSTGNAFEVGALPGANGALAFDVSEAGHVVGSSMMNQGSGRPFIWSDADGMQEVPLPAGTSQGGARGVNSAGWVVGTASNAFAIPYLFDGTQTYMVADLIPAGTGWDLSTNTSSSALSINDDGVIVGTGVFNGAVRAYAMIPVGGGCNVADIAEPFGVLDLADVQAFIAGFLGSDPIADIAPPAGVFDLADVQAFIAAFNAGCP
jgi:uncharacterized membrane protein